MVVNGTTVITPLPRFSTVALARSLLTTTAGRRFAASLPCARIEIHPVNVRAANHSVSAVTASHTSSTSPSANAAA